MERIILLETSTALCSTALVEDGKIISYKESTEPRAHAALTAQFVDDMLREHNLGVKDCDAVCVSLGPGSYTGLRVGVSTAKGLCFGAGIPLLAVGTLDILVHQAIDEGLMPEGCTHVVPMVDARRMEVYAAVFSADAQQLTQTEPVIVDSSSFAEYTSSGKVLFIGDGAGKCEGTIGGDCSFVQCCPKASAMLKPALAELASKNWRDVAYLEPFYLKEFVATVSKKNLF